MDMVPHPFEVLVGRDGARKRRDWATEQREQSGAEGLFAYIRNNSSLARIDAEKTVIWANPRFPGFQMVASR